METITPIQLIGIAGFVGYMAGFAGQQFGIIDGNSKAFSIINIISASLVLVSLTEHFNLASAMIQVSWITIGLIGLTLKAQRAKD